jgi:predicted nuclease with TOPRIM domain
MLRDTEFYANYTDFTLLIDNMREKLLKAIGTNGNKDYSEQWKMIESLERLQNLYHLMYHSQQQIEIESGKVLLERKKMMDKIYRLENELTELKKNIKI